jgi:hypothetical protein
MHKRNEQKNQIFENKVKIDSQLARMDADKLTSNKALVKTSKPAKSIKAQVHMHRLSQNDSLLSSHFLNRQD